MNMSCQRCYKVGRILKIPLFQLFELKYTKSVIVNGRTVAFGVAAGEVALEDDLTTAYDATDSSNYARLLQICVDTKALEEVIAGYVQHGDAVGSLKLFSQMHREGVKPTHFTFASVVKACGNTSSLPQALQVHAHVVKNGFASDVFAESAFIDMYAKCGYLDNARKVFDQMPERNVVSWNAMIAGYAQHGCGEDAVELFMELQRAGMKLTEFTYASVLNGFSRAMALEQGKQVHSLIVKSKIESNVFVGNALVDMYAKCLSIEDACNVFDRMPERDVVSWNSMIAGFVQNECWDDALDLFLQMPLIGVKHNQTTFTSILKDTLKGTMLQNNVRKLWCFFSKCKMHA